MGRVFGLHGNGSDGSREKVVDREDEEEEEEEDEEDEAMAAKVVVT